MRVGSSRRECVPQQLDRRRRLRTHNPFAVAIERRFHWLRQSHVNHREQRPGPEGLVHNPVHSVPRSRLTGTLIRARRFHRAVDLGVRPTHRKTIRERPGGVATWARTVANAGATNRRCGYHSRSRGLHPTTGPHGGGHRASARRRSGFCIDPRAPERAVGLLATRVQQSNTRTFGQGESPRYQLGIRMNGVWACATTALRVQEGAFGSLARAGRTDRRSRAGNVAFVSSCPVGHTWR